MNGSGDMEKSKGVRESSGGKSKVNLCKVSIAVNKIGEKQHLYGNTVTVLLTGGSL